MASYIGDSHDFRANQLHADAACPTGQSHREAGEPGGDDPGDRPVDVGGGTDLVEDKGEIRLVAILSLVGQILKMMFRATLAAIICLILLAFSSCYWYNSDADIRSKIERQKKIVEVHPDMKVKWAAFEEILLLKERHDYFRSAFPSQIMFGEATEIGPTPKEKTP